MEHVARQDGVGWDIPAAYPGTLGAVGGLAVFGAVGALGLGEPAFAWRGAVGALAVVLVPLLASVPTLVVGDLAVGGRGHVAAIAEHTMEAFDALGARAASLVPVVLFFAATSRLGAGLALVALPVLMASALWRAAVGMAQGGHVAPWTAAAWALLVALLGVEAFFRAVSFVGGAL